MVLYAGPNKESESPNNESEYVMWRVAAACARWSIARRGRREPPSACTSAQGVEIEEDMAVDYCRRVRVIVEIEEDMAVDYCRRVKVMYLYIMEDRRWRMELAP